MEIKVNNNSLLIESNTSIIALLEKIESRKTGIAVAINNGIIPKKQWETTLLKENDTIVIIEATQGG